MLKWVKPFTRRLPVVGLGNLHVEREFNVQMVPGAYLQLLQHAKPGEIYKICSEQACALEHVIETLARLTGHKIEVQVNPAFVRDGELHRLCGSAAKLDALLAAQGKTLSYPLLTEALRLMLEKSAGTDV